MIDFKNMYPEGTSNSMDHANTVFEGVACTCPRDSFVPSNKPLTNKHLLYIPFDTCKQFQNLDYSKRNSYNDDDDNIKIPKRSVSLSQILGDARTKPERRKSSQFENETSYTLSNSRSFGLSQSRHQRQPKGLNSSGSSRYGSPDTSPEGYDRPYSPDKRAESDRVLTPFERDNILYIQELKNKQKEALQNLEKQVEDLPNFPLLRDYKLPSSRDEKCTDYFVDERSPRGGSPFPRRREFPPTAFSPSKRVNSQALRSLSLEEEVEEGQPEPSNEYFSGGGHTGWRTNPWERHGGGRKLWAKSAPASEPSSLNAWWTNLTPSNSGSPVSSPSLKRKSGSPFDPCSKSVSPSGACRDSAFEFPYYQSSSPPKLKFPYRSYSSPGGPGDFAKTFVPLDLSLSFVNFEELPKCRPELEDVGGRVESILSSSPDEEDLSCARKAMLPPTVESPRENYFEEDTSKKNQELESKSKNGEPITLSKESSPPAPVAAVPTTTQHENKTPVVQNEDVKAVGEDVKTSTVEAKKPFPMAFTVDLDSANSDSSASANSGKKLDITASISQWAPKHRRNHSLTKVEEHKKVDEKQGVEKPPLGRPRSGTVGASPLSLKRGGAGYHSEGYFSSDQDDETPKRTELKSPRSPRTPETVQANPLLVRSNSQDSSKGNSSLRKFSTKSEVRTCCKERERKPSVSELTGKSYRSEKKMVTDSKKHTKTVPSDDPDNCKDDKDDDVSEAGTYTIDKDSPSPEEDRARNDIDGVFGVAMTSALESEAEGGGASTITTTTAVPHSTTECLEGEESSWFSASEMPPPALSRNSPNWIQQWAAQVAEQTKPPVIDSHPPLSKASPRTHSSPPEGPINDPRPRRKLPTPPSHLASLSPRSSDPTLSSAKHKARMEKAKGNPAFRNASFESHESGADSDFDTSASYPFNDDERMSASLKSKLRLTGLMPASKNSVTPPIAATNSPRRSEGAVESKIKSRDPSYDVYNTRRGEDRGLHSDSSSEASEPYKEVARPNDNNPPLKFNRAFSLRRARLGCDDASSATPSPGDGKKKITRPSSAGSAGTGSAGRKGGALGGSSKAYHHSVDSVSSPRGYGGFGSPRGGAAAPAASPSSAVVGSKGCPPLPSPQTDNFDRTDGGRYSLRLPRAGSSSIQGLSKSPSKTSIKKDSPSVGGRKGHSATRSNSTLSSKEVDFQNWKRRKNYDPMKAAAEGRKKQVEKKLKNTQLPSPQQSVNADSHRSPSPPGSLLRSASFHGTEGVMCNMRWNRKGNNNINQTQYTSEDDGPYSLEEEVGPHPSPRHGSPLHRSPTSPHQLCQSPIRHPPLRGRRPSLGLAEGDDAQYQSSIRKVSLDESGSEGKRSPLSSGVVARGATSSAVAATTISSTGSGRPKTKMEALDNLVISTIHSLSVKVRTTSESLLQKLKSQYDEEGDRAALLEEVLSHLSESDQSLTSGQTRSTSRELAGILRNLKKIEHALEVIDRVIIVGEEDYRDEDDIDYVPTEWVEESDY